MESTKTKEIQHNKWYRVKSTGAIVEMVRHNNFGLAYTEVREKGTDYLQSVEDKDLEELHQEYME